MSLRTTTVHVLLATLISVAPATALEGLAPPDPERGAIGARIKVKALLAMGGFLWATRGYFVRVAEGGNPLRGEEVIVSNFDRKGQVYLLNAPPGRYVLIGVMTPEFRSVKPDDPHHESAPAEVALLDGEAIPKTEVIVEPGGFACMGEITVRLIRSMEDADETQKHYGEILGTKPHISITLIGPRPPVEFLRFTRPAEFQGLDREPKTEGAFWAHAAKKVFDDEPAWLAKIQTHIEALKARP